jgi:outer membrane receptor protein involved in Fe transport
VNCKFALGDGGGPGLCAGGGGVSTMRAQLATIGHTLTLSPNLVVDGTIGFTRWAMDLVAPDYGKNWGSDFLGIPGTNGPDIRQSGFPIFSFNTYTPMGSADAWNPAFYRDQTFTHTTNVSWNHAGHDLRFGFDLVRHQFNHWQPEIGGGPRGMFSFTGGVTALKNGPSPNQYNSYADFLLGLPQTVQKSLQYEEMNPREWQFGWYFRDRWQVTSKLTLNLGVRYEFYPLIRRASRGIERYDPATNMVLIGGRGGQPDDVGIEVSSRLFAPRVGFAYRLKDNTVIRSGYGITYDPLPFSRPLEGPYPSTINGFFT